MNQFDSLFEPKSIAVVGVSDDLLRPSSQVVSALLKNDYCGKVYPINPKYSSYQGLVCYPTVCSIEQAVDVVVIGIPAQGVIETLESCVRNGASFAIILSGGFRESGEKGIELEKKMLEICRSSKLRVIGPNCLGFVNVHSNIYAAFGSMTREPKMQKGDVSLVTQSGGFGYSLAIACQKKNIGFRHILATGNESDIDCIDIIDALIDDPKTNYIVTYLEGVKNGRRLLSLGKRAFEKGKVILMWKAGITGQGERAAISHTASIVGRYDFYLSMFKQSGIIQIKEIHEVCDYLKILKSKKNLTSNGVAVLGSSGGSAIVFADTLDSLGLVLSDLEESTRLKLVEVVPQIGAVYNPIDFTAGFFSSANKDKITLALRVLLQDSKIGSICINLATTGALASKAVAEVLRDMILELLKPLVIFSSLPENLLYPTQEILEKLNIPIYSSPIRAARSLGMLYQKFCIDQQLLKNYIEEKSLTTEINKIFYEFNHSVLSENESKRVIEQIGINVSKDCFVENHELDGLKGLHPPFALKIVSKDIPHKSEYGGVVLGIKSEIELQLAINTMRDNIKKNGPHLKIEGFLISEMISDGFELIIGVIDDGVFGPVVVLGAGGIYTEVIADHTCRIAPFTVDEANKMIDELICRPILNGLRGRPTLDIQSLALCASKLSIFAWENREILKEIDINPLFVTPHGVVAADGLVVLKNHMVELKGVGYVQ